MTNLYLLDLGEEFILGRGNTFGVTIFTHPKPIDILTFIYNKNAEVNLLIPIVSFSQDIYSNMHYPKYRGLTYYTNLVQ
jgi:hypothetical protein